MTSTLSGVPGGSFSYDNNDRLSGDTSDANGNTISSAGIANTYDFENHMLSHGAVTMVYDGDGNRVAETVGSTTTKYLVDTLNPTGYAQVIDELVSGLVNRTYTYGYGRISENQKIVTTQTASFYGYDGHGNVRFLTGTAGTVSDTYVYDAFGLPLTTKIRRVMPIVYKHGQRYGLIPRNDCDNPLNLVRCHTLVTTRLWF
jgi:hypothetical protein